MKTYYILFLFLGLGRMDLAAQSNMVHSSILELQAIHEAKEFGNNKKAIILSKQFLISHLNTPTCNFNTFVELLQTLKFCSSMEGMDNDYKSFKYSLLEQLDSHQQGSYIRMLSYVVCDEKTDDDIVLLDKYKGKIDEGTISLNPFVLSWFDLLKADIYLSNDSIDKANYYVSKAKSYSENHLLADSPDFLIVLMMQEKVYAHRHDYENSSNVALRIIEKIKKKSQESRELYAAYARLQSYHYEMKNYNEALKYGREALVRESVFFKSPFYCNISLFNGEMKTNSFLDESMDIDFMKVHFTLADCLYKTGDSHNASLYARKTLFRLSREIYESYGQFAFNLASEELKQKVDNLVQNAPLYAVRVSNDSIIQSIAYNASLIHKQLTLNADLFLRNLIYEYNNPVLKERYLELDNCIQHLDQVDKNRNDSLLNRISVLKKNLRRNVLSRQTDKDSYTMNWTDVKKELGSDEVAIEFSMTSNDAGEIIYVANMVTSESPYPHSIPLCRESQLNSISEMYTTKDGYNLIWKPIESFISKKKRVFFSPIGKLYQIGIENLMIDTSGITFSDRYEAYRLSSTRELIKRNKTHRIYQGGVLFGGIEYNITQKAFNETATELSQITYYDNVDVVELGKRAGFEYLPATKTEVEQISSLLDNVKINHKTLIGVNATESALKDLDGQNVDFLHIATHGFNLQSTRNRLARIIVSDDSRSTFEEQSLSRSGLLFAGAYNTIQNYGKETSKTDDGILTAKEISRINLASVDLVVLSACETGLGTISSEGVYGLQRGLKRAGAGTIIMSLWKVDDEATSLFMRTFYKFLISGKSKQQAFVLSQKAVKNVDSEKYKDPDYWAAFVLLDGI